MAITLCFYSTGRLKYLFKNDDALIDIKFFEYSRNFASYGSLPIKFLPEVFPLLETGAQKGEQDKLLVGKSSE